MANYTHFIKRYWNLSLKTIWNDVFGEKDPDEFHPSGSQIYHGYQGEGKTLSMYYHGMHVKAKYPKCLIVSNLNLKYLEPVEIKDEEHLQRVLANIDTSTHYIRFQSYNSLILLLRRCRMGKYGVVFMIDEIHNYFHSHDSKNSPMWVVQVFSQQRKQYLVILGSVQMWPDVIKIIRDQVDNLTACRRLGHLILHTTVDPRDFENEYGEQIAPVKKKGWFWITKHTREGYDTYQVINSGREVMGGTDLHVNVNNVEKPKKLSKGYRLRA